MHKHVNTNALLLLDGICHVLIDILLVVSIAQLTLLVCQTCTPDGCRTDYSKFEITEPEDTRLCNATEKGQTTLTVTRESPWEAGTSSMHDRAMLWNEVANLIHMHVRQQGFMPTWCLGEGTNGRCGEGVCLDLLGDTVSKLGRAAELALLNV